MIPITASPTNAAIHLRRTVISVPPIVVRVRSRRARPCGRMDPSSTSNCVVAALAGPDSHRLLERLDEDLPIANAASPGSRRDQRDDLLGHAVGDHDFHLHLRQEVDRVIDAPIPRTSLTVMPTIPAPVSASFTGKVTLSDIDPPNGYKISGEGQGGAAGFAKGGAVAMR